jgi:hypothetical protein
MRKYLLAGLFLAVVSAQAASITFSTPAGSTVGSPAQSASGSAVFNVTSSNAFTITLSNTLSASGLNDAGQLLTDLEFGLTGGTVSMTGSSGQQVMVDSNGNVTTATTGTTGWGFGSTGANSYLLCIICGNGVTSTGAPSEGIVPAGTSFPNANNSIAGNKPHNPFLESGASFNFTTSSAITTASFSNVVFSFGTTFGNNVGATGSTGTSSTPEPATLMIAGAGLIGLGLLKRRNHSRPE